MQWELFLLSLSRFTRLLTGTPLRLRGSLCSLSPLLWILKYKIKNENFVTGGAQIFMIIKVVKTQLQFPANRQKLTNLFFLIKTLNFFLLLLLNTKEAQNIRLKARSVTGGGKSGGKSWTVWLWLSSQFYVCGPQWSLWQKEHQTAVK